MEKKLIVLYFEKGVLDSDFLFVSVCYSPFHENPEEAILNRRLKKSLTLFTSFDWSKIPRFLQRRTSDNVFGEPAIVTRVYR